MNDANDADTYRHEISVDYFNFFVYTIVCLVHCAELFIGHILPSSAAAVVGEECVEKRKQGRKAANFAV